MDPLRDERSIGNLFSDLTRETSALFRTELALAQTEILERLDRFGAGLAMVVIGGLLLHAALLALLVALTLGLGQVFDWWPTMPWLPPLIVGIVVAAIGAVLLIRGKSDIRPGQLIPRRALASMKEDAAWARQKVR
jgi:xanthine/uracil permease